MQKNHNLVFNGCIKAIQFFLNLVIINLIISSAVAAPSGTKQLSHQKQNSEFVHAAYVIADKIKNKEQLDDITEQFNFIYAFKGGPVWKPEDFEQTEAFVMEKLVHKHSYPDGDSGLALMTDLIKKAHEKNVKVLLSIPSRNTFNPIAANDEKRALFVRVMTAFCEKYNFDGIEVDWEGNISISNHMKLMRDYRIALDKRPNSSKKYFLTTALHAWRHYSKKDANILSDYVDWINIMTYDMGGGRWGKVPTHNAPLDDMKKKLAERWSNFSPNKLCIGFASYGFYYEGILPGEKCEHLRRDKKARYFAYNELPQLLLKGWTESYDTCAEAPYYFSPDNNAFVTIDNNKSHGKKLEWVIDKNFRGIFWWEYQYDYNPPTSNKTKASHPLIDHVSNILNEKLK